MWHKSFIIMIFSGVAILFAQIPRTINYQGKLTNTIGVAINGSYSLTFRIFDVESGGTALWSETHFSVPITKGMFSVILGSETALNLPFDDQYWIEIAVNGEVLSPRQPLTSVCYSFHAKVADSIAGGIPVWCDSAAYVHWDSIEGIPDSIYSGGFNKLRANGSPWLTDSVTLAEGMNITLTQTGDSIIISASDTGGSSCCKTMVTLTPQYPSVIFTNLGGYSRDSVWIRTVVSTIDNKTYYEVTGAYGHDNQKYDIVAIWHVPRNISSIDSMRIFYQTLTDDDEDNSVKYSIRKPDGTEYAFSSDLCSSTGDSWKPIDLLLSAIAPGEELWIVSEMLSDSDKWARTGDIKIYYSY